MKDTVKIFSLNGNAYTYNYINNVLQPSEKYNHDLITNLSKKYYIDIEDIKENAFINDFKKEKHRCLGIVLTDQCNFRCSYCANSCAYEFSKGYKSNSISSEILDEALEYYTRNYCECVIWDPNLRYSIMFYGGEPLLEFDKIKYVVDRVINYYSIKEPIFTITTNGYLITNEVIDFFRKYDFDVNVSMDGYKDIHDKNRKLINGRGTFNRVVKNYYKLRKELGKDKVGIITTFDTQVSPKKLYNFYLENPEIDKGLRRVSSVNTINTDYYSSISKYKNYDREVNFLYKLYNDGDKTNFIKMFYEDKFGGLINRLEFHNITKLVCPPLNAKLTVSTNGDYHICEKVNENYSIGNTQNGIDKKKAYKYYRNVIDIRINSCSSCKIKNLCNPCFANLNRKGKTFELKNEECVKMREGTVRILEIYCTFLDNMPWPHTGKSLNDRDLFN